MKTNVTEFFKIEKINETKSWFSVKNQQNRHSATMTKKKRVKTQITGIRNERSNTTTNLTNIKSTIKKYNDQGLPWWHSG